MYDFVGKTKIWFTFSSILMIVSVGALLFNAFVHGKMLNFGQDFTGGTMINLRFPAKISVDEVRQGLVKFKLENSVIQKAGETDIFVRTEPLEPEVRKQIVDSLNEKYGGNVELLETDTIGPMIGKELASQAIWALIIASIGIIIYVSFRFEFSYALAAIIALYHDAIIVTGLTALFWRNVETPFVAAIMTIMGYSINDTIVIFDRIRENSKKYVGKKMKFAEIINISVSETMTRSINTVLTVVITALAVLIFGGATLRDFMLTLLIGFMFGAYSSIFIASPLVYFWHGKK